MARLRRNRGFETIFFRLLAFAQSEAALKIDLMDWQVAERMMVLPEVAL